ncbi:MAG: hypothetical protein DWQ08_08420 [Proteobacteria bacterium]|nr:MAG: hypothetical protein DWQ08_08420 [Pseudomonadota bacterium]
MTCESLISELDGNTLRRIVAEASGVRGPFRLFIESEKLPPSDGKNSDSREVAFRVEPVDDRIRTIQVFVKKPRLNVVESDRFRLLRDMGVNVPRLFHSSMGNDGREILVMEYCECHSSEPCSKSRLLEAAQLAARVNSIERDRIPNSKPVDSQRLWAYWSRAMQLVFSAIRFGQLSAERLDLDRHSVKRLMSLANGTYHAVRCLPHAVSIQSLDKWMSVGVDRSGCLAVYDLSSLCVEPRAVNLATIVVSADAAGLGPKFVRSIIDTYIDNLSPEGTIPKFAQLEEELRWCMRRCSLNRFMTRVRREIMNSNALVDVGEICQSLESLSREARSLHPDPGLSRLALGPPNKEPVSKVYGFDREFLSGIAKKMNEENGSIERVLRWRDAPLRQGMNSDTSTITMVDQRGQAEDLFVKRQVSPRLTEAPCYEFLKRKAIPAPVLYRSEKDAAGCEVLFLERVLQPEISVSDPLQVESLLRLIARLNCTPCDTALAEYSENRFTARFASWRRTILDLFDQWELDPDTHGDPLIMERSRVVSQIDEIESCLDRTPFGLGLIDPHQGNFGWREERSEVFMFDLVGMGLTPRFLTVTQVIAAFEKSLGCCWTARALAEVYLHYYVCYSGIDVPLEKFRSEAQLCLAACWIKKIEWAVSGARQETKSPRELLDSTQHALYRILTWLPASAGREH